jgi:hypothetical protein
MKTWVLLIIMYTQAGGQPVGITSVPGYTSLGDCMDAGGSRSKRAARVDVHRLHTWTAEMIWLLTRPGLFWELMFWLLILELARVIGG